MEEEEIADFLPRRLYGQMAVYMHMETLRRVKLFEVNHLLNWKEEK